MGFINSIFGSILSFIFEGVALISPVAALGISIIFFTLVTRILLTPLQISSQRTSRGLSKIQPELQKIQDKYKGKKDQQSQVKQSQEMQALYKRYKINPFAGCLPLIIQLPLIYALFNVLREPAKYIGKLSNEYFNVANIVIDNVSNYQSLLEPYQASIQSVTRATFDLGDSGQLGLFLSHLNTVQWQEFLSNVSASTRTALESATQLSNKYETFLGFNVVDTPNAVIATQWWVILIPIIAGASTYIFTKLTMAANGQAQAAAASGKNGQPNPGESMMKTMNIVMPIMTGFFAYTMPIGLALYWISSNVFMMGQQWIVSKILEKQDAKLEAQLKKEREEAAKNQTIQKKKVMKKVPVPKKVEPVKPEAEVSTSTLSLEKPDTASQKDDIIVEYDENGKKIYKKKVMKKVPVKKEGQE